MKKLLFIFILLPGLCFGQSKKEQIETLNHSIDSLMLVLSKTRDNSVKDIHKLNKTIDGLNTNVKEITKEKTTLKNTLTISQNSNKNLSIDLGDIQLDLTEANEKHTKIIDSLTAQIIEQQATIDSVKESKYKGDKQMKFTGYEEGDQPHILFEENDAKGEYRNENTGETWAIYYSDSRNEFVAMYTVFIEGTSTQDEEIIIDRIEKISSGVFKIHMKEISGEMVPTWILKYNSDKKFYDLHTHSYDVMLDSWLDTIFTGNSNNG